MAVLSQRYVFFPTCPQHAELRAAQRELVSANLRIQKLKANPSAFDAPSDPAIARVAQEIVTSDLVMDLYRRLACAQFEAVHLGAQLAACQQRAGLPEAGK